MSVDEETLGPSLETMRYCPNAEMAAIQCGLSATISQPQWLLSEYDGGKFYLASALPLLFYFRRLK